MIQGRSRIGFLIKTTETIAMLGEFLGQQLEGDFPAQLGVLRQIDFTHAARAELFEDAITGNGFQFHRDPVYFERINCSSCAAFAPRIRTVLLFELVPATISTAFRDNLNDFARTLTNSLFAAPATGGAAMRTRSAPSCSPTMPLDEARGTTRTAKVRPPSCCE